MSLPLNETHDPGVKSWVDSANRPGCDFPLQNLPLGICRARRGQAAPRVFTAIGNLALDIAGARADGLLGGLPDAVVDACAAPILNKLMALGQPASSALRRQLHQLLRDGGGSAPGSRDAAKKHLLPLAEIELFLPAWIGDYTDFYASIHHAARVGSLFRPNEPLLPNYKWLPVAYHGRASSIVISGTPVVRPRGQTHTASLGGVEFRPTERLDYELEVGFYTGPANPLGSAIHIQDAESHVFGLSLVNDWSARDIQTWEYQPLGPFLAKNFCTTVSPWVVTLEALAPFRSRALPRRQDDPAPLPHLFSAQDQESGGIDLTLEVRLLSERMRQQGCEPMLVSSGNFREMYWTIAQMLAHHTSNGCNLRPGDLIASGTVSGASEQSRGCLLELTSGGAVPISLPTGEKRRFLEDGDEVIFRGYCESPTAARIGFGECRGVVQPAIA
jgi:fumarylacetoacetase